MNRLSLTAALALATLTSTPAAARGTTAPTAERETRSSERPTRASSSSESTRVVARIAAAMASSDDFGTLLSARTQYALSRYPTQSRVEAATIEATQNLIEQTGITDTNILFMILTVLIEAEVDPVGLTSALIASNLGCTEAEDCIELGELVLSMSTVVDQACYDGGATRLTDCKDLAGSEIKWVMEAAYAAELEHFKDLEQTILSGLDTASGPGAGGAGGGLGLLADCGVIDDGAATDPLAPAYADTCMGFGPAGDPAFLVVDEATVTPVSPFFDFSSSCYGLNPAMLFTSDGGGSGDWDDADEWSGVVFGAISIEAVALAVLTKSGPGLIALATVVAIATVYDGHTSGDYDVLYDAVETGHAAAVAATADVIETVVETVGDAHASAVDETADAIGTVVDAVETGHAAAVDATADAIGAVADAHDAAVDKTADAIEAGVNAIKNLLGSNDYDLEGSMASCGEELTQSFGECVPSGASDDAGDFASDYAASVVPDAEGTDCGVAQICSNPVLAELAVYATLCGVWDPSPIDQSSSLSVLGSSSAMIDCDAVGGPDCGSPWDTETADEISDCAPGVDCPDDL